MSENQEIPKNWDLVTLGDVGTIVSGGTPSTSVPEYWNGEINWITPADLSGYFNKYISRGAKSISEAGLKKSSAKLMPKGAVLFSSRAPVGYVVIANSELCTNQGFKSIIPNQTIFNVYLFYFLKSAKRKAEDAASGTTFKEISLANFSKLQIPLPPLPEQHRIVAKIEELFSSLDKGIESLKTVQQQLKVYRRAVLKWAFEGKLTNKNIKEGELPKGWKWVLITDLVEKNKNALKAGPFGSSLKKQFYVKRGYKIYGQEQVICGNPFYGDYYVNEDKYQELSSNKIRPFDILISLVGTVGKVLILPENCVAGIINPRLIKVSLDTNVYLPKFFKFYFESSTVKSFYSSKAQGTTMDVLNLSIIKRINFPLCPISEQHAIVAEIESRLSVCDKIEESIEQSLKQAESLRQSILKKAFAGKLVPQDPNDEPASKLLERIKMEKEKTVSKKRSFK